jgi:hypothetical protein
MFRCLWRDYRYLRLLSTNLRPLCCLSNLISASTLKRIARILRRVLEVVAAPHLAAVIEKLLSRIKASLILDSSSTKVSFLANGAKFSSPQHPTCRPFCWKFDNAESIASVLEAPHSDGFEELPAFLLDTRIFDWASCASLGWERSDAIRFPACVTGLTLCRSEYDLPLGCWDASSERSSFKAFCSSSHFLKRQRKNAQRH